MLQCYKCYFNPRAPYGARLEDVGKLLIPADISIHAPHTGRDCPPVRVLLPHSLFQSTRPIRGATSYGGRLEITVAISIHAPHTGRDELDEGLIDHILISIHAPHTGRDMNGPLKLLCSSSFQSTRPIRGATVKKVLVKVHF